MQEAESPLRAYQDSIRQHQFPDRRIMRFMRQGINDLPREGRTDCQQAWAGCQKTVIVSLAMSQSMSGSIEGGTGNQHGIHVFHTHQWQGHFWFQQSEDRKSVV